MVGADAAVRAAHRGHAGARDKASTFARESARARRRGDRVSHDRDGRRRISTRRSMRDRAARCVRLDDLHQRHRGRGVSSSGCDAGPAIFARWARRRIAAIGPATAARARRIWAQGRGDARRVSRRGDHRRDRRATDSRRAHPDSARRGRPRSAARMLRANGAREVVVAPAYRTVEPQRATSSGCARLIAAGGNRSGDIHQFQHGHEFLRADGGRAGGH